MERRYLWEASAFFLEQIDCGLFFYLIKKQFEEDGKEEKHFLLRSLLTPAPLPLPSGSYTLWRANQ